ncbi:MAG: elongation factor G [SAR202 cluster bacterium]|nr:elongation factor G [SAR202 cluster bacterium]
MPSPEASKIRNVVLLSHSGSGKSALSEALLFATKAINRMGTAEAGNTVSDYEPEEAKRRSSTQTSLVPCQYSGFKINFLDTPGYDDFRGEVVPALRVCEGAVIVISAISGVEVGTENSWNMCKERNLPRIIFVNKMDRENADFQRTLNGIQAAFGRSCVPFQLPIGSAQDFKGIVNLLGKGENATASMKDEASKAKERLIEAVAESDDELANKYLEGQEIKPEELEKALKKAIQSGDLVPVLAGSATQAAGVEELLQLVTGYMPSPMEVGKTEAKNQSNGEKVELSPSKDGTLASLVFKTTADPFVGKLSFFRVYSGVFKANGEVWNANKGQSERIGQVYFMRGKTQEPTPEVGPGDIGAVSKLAVTTTSDTLCQKDKPLVFDPVVFPVGFYSMAVSPKTKADLDKMSQALARIVEEDPSLKLSREASTSETLLSGLGDVHLETTVEKVKRKFGTELTLNLPRVPYRETITSVTRSEYKHKKQSGGHGQYGHVLLRLEPRERDSGFEFAHEVVGGSVPREFWPAVEKGVTKSLGEGALAGYPVVDVKVVLYDGSYHDVDSSGMSFEIAAVQAFKKGMLDGRPTLLEPIMKLTVKVPDANTGDVIGDMNGKRGRIMGMIPENGFTTIEAEVPLAELLRYSSDLRSLTQGRASYSMEPSRYEPVPPAIGQKVVEEAKRVKEGAKA